MSRECEVCKKKALKANKVSFSHKHHTYRQYPNLQLIKVNLNGTIKRIKICTSCLRARKVQKAV